MKKFLVRTAFSAFGLWIATQYVDGVSVAGAGSLGGAARLAAAALLLGVVNAVARPVLILLTLPITILTLGLFLLVINAATFALVAALMPGFRVTGLVPALLGSLVVCLAGWVGSWFARD